MRILIIDDNKDLLELVSYTLMLEGHEVFTSPNGEEGIKEAVRKKPDLILLDIMMPIMDGFQTCQKMKSHKKLKDIPVIMLTALSAMGDIEKAFRCGANDYISKPFEIHQLGETISRKITQYKTKQTEK